MRALWVAAILLLDAGPVRAQQGDRWQLTLNDGTIRWELHLIRFRGDTLAVQQGDSTLRFPVMHLGAKLSFNNISHPKKACFGRHQGIRCHTGEACPWNTWNGDAEMTKPTQRRKPDALRGLSRGRAGWLPRRVSEFLDRAPPAA